MSSTSSSPEETISPIYSTSFSSITSDDDDEDFIDDDDRSIEPVDQTVHGKNNKKTLGRIKIKMAFIDNKIRRYTTFSKRKTGIMKKAYELATLTGTEVMLLVASETGHVYTYATSKLQPMITSETGKALIQTCLAKDEPIIETPTVTTLNNNNDALFMDENPKKKRKNIDSDAQSTDVSTKRRKLKPSDKLSSFNETKPVNTSLTCSSATTIAPPLSCYIKSDPHQQTITSPSSYTIDLNSLKNNQINIIFTPSSSSDFPQSSSLSLGNFPYQPS